MNDFSTEFTIDKNVAQEKTDPSPPSPKKWKLISLAQNVPFQIKDEDTGEIFTVICEMPEAEVDEGNENVENVKENATLIDEEDEMSWCSAYLFIRVIGQFLEKPLGC